jgi:two-component system NarL family sensor kinase
LTDGRRRAWAAAFAAGAIACRLRAAARAREQADATLREQAARRRIVAEALAAEDRARERISQQLHDDVLQALFVIRQDLAQVAADPRRTDLLARAHDGILEAIHSLRAAVVDIHPAVVERGGLPAAVRAVAQHHAQRGGFAIEVEVAPEAEGEHGRLLLSLVRELLANVARHAGATHAVVRLGREGDAVVLEVSDDGRGIDLAGARLAVQQGHIGLASAAQRVEALRGRFELSRRPGGGTTARATIPLG